MREDLHQEQGGKKDQHLESTAPVDSACGFSACPMAGLALIMVVHMLSMQNVPS